MLNSFVGKFCLLIALILLGLAFQDVQAKNCVTLTGKIQCVALKKPIMKGPNAEMSQQGTLSLRATSRKALSQFAAAQLQYFPSRRELKQIVQAFLTGSIRADYLPKESSSKGMILKHDYTFMTYDKKEQFPVSLGILTTKSTAVPTGSPKETDGMNISVRTDEVLSGTGLFKNVILSAQSNGSVLVPKNKPFSGQLVDTLDTTFTFCSLNELP